jgi:hypothetical protein
MHRIFDFVQLNLKIKQQLGVCRTLAILTDDIARERRRPYPAEIILQ